MTKPKTKNYLISGILAGILCGMIAIFMIMKAKTRNGIPKVRQHF